MVLQELLSDQPQNAPTDKLAQVLNQVSALRFNDQTRMNVFLARYGESGEHDSRYLDHKDKIDSPTLYNLVKHTHNNFSIAKRSMLRLLAKNVEILLFKYV